MCSISTNRVKEARLQTLAAEFGRLRMGESESDLFIGNLAALSSQSAALGQTIEESKLVTKFTSLPRSKFIQIVDSLEQVLDLKTVGFEDIVERIKASEERIRDRDEGDGQPKVFWSSSGGGSEGSSTGGGGGSTKRGAGGSGVSSASKEKKGGMRWVIHPGLIRNGSRFLNGLNGRSNCHQPNFNSNQPNSDK